MPTYQDVQDVLQEFDRQITNRLRTTLTRSKRSTGLLVDTAEEVARLEAAKQVWVRWQDKVVGLSKGREVT